MKLSALLGNYDSETDRTSNGQTDRPGHREVSLPIIMFRKKNDGNGLTTLIMTFLRFFGSCYPI